MIPHWDGGWGVGTWLLMGFGMLVFWALVVALIVWVVRITGGHRSGPNGPMGPGEPADLPAAHERSMARDILDERYARGEIGEEEYRTRRDTLASR
jgi:putative membrane protein